MGGLLVFAQKRSIFKAKICVSNANNGVQLFLKWNPGPVMFLETIFVRSLHQHFPLVTYFRLVSFKLCSSNWQQFILEIIFRHVIDFVEKPTGFWFLFHRGKIGALWYIGMPSTCHATGPGLIQAWNLECEINMINIYRRFLSRSCVYDSLVVPNK